MDRKVPQSVPGSLANTNGTEEAAAMRKVMFAAFLAFAYLRSVAESAAELKQETSEAFDHYVRVTEDRMAEELNDGQSFLIAPSSEAAQNEGHSRVILHILERSLCAPQES